MRSEIILRSLDGLKSVRASKLKSFSITNVGANYIVEGWFNQDHSFVFGEWKTLKEAERYHQEIIKQIERG